MSSPGYNLFELLRIVARTVPAREALVCNQRRCTFAELEQRSERLARWLASRGIAAGDAVAIHAANSIEHMEAWFASLALGAMPVNVNYRYVGDEIRYLYANAEPKALVFDAGFEERIAPVIDAAPGLTTLVRIGEPVAPLLAATGFEAAVAEGGAPLPDAGRSGDDVLLLYTGGTTGLPKGVMWTHEAMFFGAFGGGGNFAPKGAISRPEELAERVGENFACVHLPCGPLMHGSGMWATMIGLFAGHRVVLNGRQDFSAEYILDLMQRERVSILSIIGDAMGVPLLDALRRDRTRWDLSSLTVLSSAGALFSDHVRDGLRALLPPAVVVVNGLGSSESGQVGGGDKPPGEGVLRLRPSPGAAVATEDGRRFAQPGETGILVRMGHLPLGYFKDPVKTAATFVNIEGRRCVLIGDIARLEADGSITVFGRGSQCINSGGEKVFTEEVEEAVRSAHGVLDALVVGVADARWGQKVVAIVAPRPGAARDADALKAHCRSRLAGYKVPKDVIWVDEVRRSPVGKADYAWAREVAASVRSA